MFEHPAVERVAFGPIHRPLEVAQEMAESSFRDSEWALGSGDVNNIILTKRQKKRPILAKVSPEPRRGYDTLIDEAEMNHRRRAFARRWSRKYRVLVDKVTLSGGFVFLRRKALRRQCRLPNSEPA